VELQFTVSQGLNRGRFNGEAPGRLGLGGPRAVKQFGANLPLVFKLHEICLVDSQKNH